MAGFTERIAAALDIDRALEAGPRVHDVVVQELHELDPNIQVTATSYFNHSFVPDVVVSWSEAGRSYERPVYLRHSLRSSRAAGDLEEVRRPAETALYLSLSPEEPEADRIATRQAVLTANRSRALVTTAPAIDELTRTDPVPDPVLGIVRSSVVRSARGFVVEDDVEKLILPRDRKITGEDLSAFRDTVETSFSEDAVVRINRVFGIVEQAVREDEEPDITGFTFGRLTANEIRELLPYLLGLDGVTQNRAFWQSIAQMVDLQEIERLWPAFDGVDLTPLASAASSVWRAERAHLSLRSDAIDDEDFDASPRWTVVSNRLAAEVGTWRIAFAYTPTKLKASGRDGLPARWEDLKPALAAYRVSGAELAGVVTRSTYGLAEGADLDMTARIDSFIESADDSFHVPGVTVGTGVGDAAVTISADFREMLLEAKPDASLRALTGVALDVLGYRYPVASEDVEALLATDPAADTASDPTSFDATSAEAGGDASRAEDSE